MGRDVSGQPPDATLPPTPQLWGNRGSGLRACLIVLAAYLLLALILTYPLVRRFATHIPGGNVDEGAFLWNLWWVKRAVLDLQTNPLLTDAMFYPLGVNLALYTLTPLHGLLAIPVALFGNLIVANNVLFVLAFVLSGFAAYLLALDVLGERSRAARLAAFVAGVVYTFASSRFIYGALGQYDYVATQWLPLTILFFLRAVRRPGWRAPALAGIFAVCAGLTELNQVFFLFVFVLTHIVYSWLRQRSAVFNRAVGARLAVALLIFAIGFGPLGLAVVQETMQSGDYIVSGWGGADRFVFDLFAPFVPSPLHPLSGEWAREAARSFTDINFGFVGYLALLLAAIGAVGGRRWAASSKMWTLMAGVFFVLALGPLLHVNGQSTFDIDGLPVNIPLPYIVVHYLPILKGARVPGRFGIMVTLALAMLVAIACWRILGKLRRAGWQWLLAAAIAAALVLENMAVPLPLSYAVAPEPYQRIAAEPGDFSILQIPLGWRDGFGTLGRERTLLLSYQSVHQKRVLSGNRSRSPAYVLDYYANLPIVRSIIALQDGRSLEAATVVSDRSQAAAVFGFFDIRYIVVHGDEVGGPVDAYIQAVLPVQRLAAGTGQAENSFWRFDSAGKWVERRVEKTDWVLYSVRPAAPKPVTIVDVGAPAAQMYLPGGWSRAETMGEITFSWADARQALVLMRLDQPQHARLSMRVAPFSYPGAKTQRVTVVANGRTIGEIELQDGWHEYSMPVPASALRGGINEIRLRFAHLASPAQTLGGDDQRTLAAAVDWIVLE